MFTIARLTAAACLLIPPPAATFGKWAKIELTFAGPPSQGRGKVNPFAIALDATFTGPAGRKMTVPGFYDGDGRGGLDGNVWKVRFSADKEGRWSYATRSDHPRLNGKRGSFTVTAVPDDARGFWKSGRLEYTGTPKNSIRYLKFRDGGYWLKAGCDDPENFLGKSPPLDTPAERRAAVDYLADRGVNSIYMMTHNLDGDDKDVWPWLGDSPREAKANGGRDARFDVARLGEWLALFEHMQGRGVVPYLVLEDDSAWDGYDHRRYYREMIARFGHLPGLIFNFNEEYNENYRLSEALAHVRTLAEFDPYGHPWGIHNVNRPSDAYVDAPQVHFSAIQTKGSDRLAHNRWAIEWIDRCRRRGRRVLMVGFDEGRPEEDRRGWWSAYLGGGVWETHVRKPYDRPLSAWEPAWTQLGGARAFMESLPFWEMRPANDLIVSGKAFCLAKPGEAYALYLPDGGKVTITLAPNREYDSAWWSPKNSREGAFIKAGRVKGGRRTWEAPGKGDWALRVLRTR